jgi:type III restriction enzyme
MAKAVQFTKRPNVTIDPKAIQDSGLLKNTLTLDIPDEAGDFETTMVRDATLDFVDVSERWEEYRNHEGLENPVLPLLVIQIPNKSEVKSTARRAAMRRMPSYTGCWKPSESTGQR